MATQRRLYRRKRSRIIIAIVRRPFGDHGGHILVCELECGHKVEHLSSSSWKVGVSTTCRECR